MIDTFDIKITQTSQSRLSELDYENIEFGKLYSDHMFTADYRDGEWTDLQITPYKDLSLSPATSAIHYGQSIFEGMKAHRNPEGRINVFRPMENAKRLNESAKRMCMPEFPTDLFMDALARLLKIDSDWVPPTAGTSLYIRPFMFATDEYIGVKPSDTYKFMVFTCPVGKYYGEPVKVLIEENFVRSADGGVGFAKAAGNYGSALYPAKLAQEKGYHQLVWTDAKEHKYIEESGTMNVIFQIGGKLITPPSSSTILAGITRRSILELAKSKGIEVEERKVTVDEIIQALKNGTLEDAFGAGTAATIAHIKTIGFRGEDFELPAIENRTISVELAEDLMNLKRGITTDSFDWIFTV